MIYSLLAPEWLQQEHGDARPLEGEFSQSDIETYNAIGYNIYFFPNYPKFYHNDGFVKGKDIDTFEWVFVDCDLKDGDYASKEDFVAELGKYLTPTKIVDSGGGVHAYWRISDLDSTSFLTLNRRLARLFNTDLAVGKIKQLMRVPNTQNTKVKGNPRLCAVWYESEDIYTCEDIDKMLPPLTPEDDEYCKRHYDQTYNTNTARLEVDESLPPKFGELLSKNLEAKDIWLGNTGDRSKSDFRLGHLMLAAGFTKQEALSVLVNSGKALGRSLGHRISYAENIIDKIWTYEEAKNTKTFKSLSSSVEEILNRDPASTMSGKRIYCDALVDATYAGYRLGQVMGLVGGSGCGKTAFTLNLFRWFVQMNPEYVHFFVSLEQPEREIANRWAKMSGNSTDLTGKVQVLGNYNEDGTYRHLSLDNIREYILAFEKETKQKVGCVVLDHIGVLKKSNKDGETQGLIEICQSLKSFAVETNTFFVVQSQTSREKAGIGDLELNKDAAFGTTTFEWYCDYLLTIWMPLKRVYDQAPNMTVTAFKYCKIREKDIRKDNVQEDQRYTLMFDPETEYFRQMTKDEHTSFDFWNGTATSLRKQDRKTDILEYKSIGWVTNDT